MFDLDEYARDVIVYCLLGGFALAVPVMAAGYAAAAVTHRIWKIGEVK